jgi:protoporphyrinogen oxidase
VLIAGAGPAGLTAALELLRRSNWRVTVIEADEQVGGISKTVQYRGNRMDLGGHRFFSKSDWVMNWWQEILPIEPLARDGPLRISYQRVSRNLNPALATPSSPDAVMLVRERLSRIFYRRHFFDYPLKLDAATLKKIGLLETLKVGASYAHSRVSRRAPETSLEDFLINRFGKRLYRTFFKDYTEKVWGVPCGEISAEWGAQRIKGLSISKAIAHALRRSLLGAGNSQKPVETSLIERFLYPKFGPGQMWEEVARRVQAKGGEILMRHRVVGVHRQGNRVTALRVRDLVSQSERDLPCMQFVSTLPVCDLVEMLQPGDTRLERVAGALPYRDFMTAGLLLRSMRGTGADQAARGMPPDNWIYIQEPEVRIGRLQVFNNWSPGLVADPKTIWLGLEYFCREHDELWSMRNENFLDFAARELEMIGMIDRSEVLDGTVVRVPKAYPAYFGEYREFDRVRRYLDNLSNLYPVGRNGMHRYNNQDHSMLTGLRAVESMLNGASKASVWEVNAEQDYHEEGD